MSLVDSVEVLVVGAGVSGLSLANWLRAEAAARGAAPPEVLILEAEAEPGGYCRTVVQDGFVWDYSGHFFHFRHPEIEAWLRARMPGAEVRTVKKRSFIRYRGRDIDFPFQKNIHQLERDDFIDCLVSLYFKDEGRDPAAPPRSFKEMLLGRLGRGICERFLIPYNEKLYACDLDTLDPDAMGRFFPHAEVADIIRNMQRPDNASYNATFTYPRGGAVEYVRALLRDLPAGALACGEPVTAIDVERRIARTPAREIRYRHLVSSAPFPRLLAMAGVEHDPAVFTCNKVAVFNLGFDRKGRDDAHWIYFPDRSLSFYRVGYYDNIHQGDRMSLYVEIGAAAGDPLDLDALRARVLADLEREGITSGHRLVSHHQLVLDPAYVHITARSLAEHRRLSSALGAAGVHTVGRYGGWTYCSIEDNMVETRELARRLAAS
ncbi:MAG TPA: FAD-dependent oxidoreductase [Kofleriaceae bacterium]|nr:FAD-dependent oxidoreductase [Kofleriaceae bacterium]